MKCFMCADKGVKTEATHTFFFDISRGFFAVGEEPRTCQAHADVIRECSDEERAVLLGRFEATDEPPNRTTNPIDDAIVRSNDLKRRGDA